MKKTLAILLSLALVICMIPATAATAFAEENQYTVTLSQTEFTYNGSPQAPTVTVKENGTSVSSSDYTVTYAKKTSGGNFETETNNVPTDVGEYKVTVASTQAGTESQGRKGEASYSIKAVALANSAIEIKSEGKISDAYTTNNTDVPFDQSGLTVYMNGYTNSKIFNNANLKVTVTAVENKVATLKVEGQSNGNITGSKESLKVNQATGLTSANTTVTASSSPTYNGTAQNVNLTVKYTVDSQTTTLRQGTDFTVSPASVTNVSEKKFEIIGKGSYAGSFETDNLDYIQPKSVGTSNGANNVYVSTVPTQVVGATPAVEVTDVIAGKTTKLTLGTDYLCDIKTATEGKNKGSATITFKGNYSGTRTQTFDVVNAAYDISKANVSIYNYKTKTYTGSAQYPDYLTVTLTPSGESTRTLVKGTDYTVSYEYTKDGKTYTATAPEDAGTYTIVITGKGSYGGVQRAGTFTISAYNLKDANISVTVASATSTPSVSVRTTGGTYFTKDVDYTLRYTPNYNKTKVTVTLSGMGTNLTGYYSKDYSVYSTSISYCTLSFSDNKTSAAYTGYTIPKTVVVKYGSATLTQGSDYDLTIKNAAGTTVSSVKDAGTYTFTVTGKNGWYGSSSITFTVTGNDISAYNVVLDKTSISATGSNVTLPKVTRVYSGSSTLSTSEYTVRYQNAAGTTVTSAYAPGTYKVVVTGAGKYSGSTSATFTIVGKNQTITGVSSTYKKYKTSEAFQLSPSATEGSFTYTSSDSSVATVSSTGLVTPLKAGRAKITIKTTGNSKYNPAEYSTVIKVYPNRAVLTQKPWTAGDSKVKVRWNKQEGATRYEVRYSRSKSFASGTYLTKKVDAAVNDYDTQSTTLKNLTSGSKYYVKVRAVTEVYNDYGKKLTYYGNWSKWKSVVAE